MKATVRRFFADAETGKRYAAGEVFEGPAQRVAELRAAGVLERGKGKPAEKTADGV